MNGWASLKRRESGYEGSVKDDRLLKINNIGPVFSLFSGQCIFIFHPIFFFFFGQFYMHIAGIFSIGR